MLKQLFESLCWDWTHRIQKIKDAYYTIEVHRKLDVGRKRGGGGSAEEIVYLF